MGRSANLAEVDRLLHSPETWSDPSAKNLNWSQWSTPLAISNDPRYSDYAQKLTIWRRVVSGRWGGGREAQYISARKTKWAAVRYFYASTRLLYAGLVQIAAGAGERLGTTANSTRTISSHLFEATHQKTWVDVGDSCRCARDRLQEHYRSTIYAKAEDTAFSCQIGGGASCVLFLLEVGFLDFPKYGTIQSIVCHCGRLDGSTNRGKLSVAVADLPCDCNDLILDRKIPETF